MPDLIAQGPSNRERWRRELPAPTKGIKVMVGRTDADWNVPWDSTISRNHVVLSPLADGRVKVTRVATARNPVFYRGRKVSEFVLVAGDHFVIGSTTFTLANRPGASDAPVAGDVTEHAYNHIALGRQRFRDANARIDMLSHLPDLILGSGSDEELLVRVASVLLQSTPLASAVAITAVSPVGGSARDDSAGDDSGGDESPEEDSLRSTGIRILHYDSRVPGKQGPPVSARLVHAATVRRESVLHLWASARGANAAYTASEDVDWAFCVPLRSESCPGWALYVTGQLGADGAADYGKSLQAAPEDLEDDVKFAELVGTTIANLRQTLRLERRQSEMRHFFAPVVMDAMAGRDTDEVLAPREADLSVMFCDLRGFSRRSEQEAGHLLDLLASVSDALGIMTRHILDTDGVIGDFHGDAAMGFWGWPLEQGDTASRAASAAIGIRSQIHLGGGDGFGCGIGIATGRAVAGRIGTIDQVKVTAFGPVVNLASRLEGLTKAFGVEVILDDVTAKTLKANVSSDFRIRRLARVRPSGLESEVDVYELMAPVDNSNYRLTDHQIAEYETSLEALIQGDWEEAYRGLHALPSSDRPKDVLLSTILRYNREPPTDWNGVIDFPKY